MTPKCREAINLSWFFICFCFSKSLLIKSVILVGLVCTTAHPLLVFSKVGYFNASLSNCLLVYTLNCMIRDVLLSRGGEMGMMDDSFIYTE